MYKHVLETIKSSAIFKLMMIMDRSLARDFIWKLIVGGQGGVGKSTILYRFVHGEFLESMKLTIGVEFHRQSLERQDYRVSLILWDLGGQEQFRPIQGDYIRGSSGGFICFDMSRPLTLEETRSWIKLFQDCIPNMPILLIGTKFDLLENVENIMKGAEINNKTKSIIEDANEIVKEYNLMGLAITSAKTGYNVNESIYYMVDWILYDMNQAENSSSNPGISLESNFTNSNFS